MKHIVLILIALDIAVVSHGQTVSCDSCRQLNIDLGVAVSGTFFFPNNNLSPYYSRFGATIHIPLITSFNLSPRWSLKGGLRYDFSWSPLHYRVVCNRYSEGVDFPAMPQSGTQHAHVFHGYLGIPLNVMWHPFPSAKRNSEYLTVGFDLFVAYAISRYISITDMDVSRDGIAVDEDINQSDALLPWKIEVGLSVESPYIGLIHGIRLFTNLLPTYRDLVTDAKIYTFGINIFL